MAFLNSAGLKTLTAQLAETYGTKDDLLAVTAEVDAKIAACATKDDLSDVVRLSALSGLLTYEAAEQKFLTMADTANFVEECRLADFAENSALENYLTLDDAAKFAEKSELEGYVTTTQLDSTLQNYSTSVALNAKLQAFVTAMDFTAALQNYATNAAVDEKLQAFVTATDFNSALDNYATSAVIDEKLQAFVTTTNFTAALDNCATKGQVESFLQALAKPIEIQAGASFATVTVDGKTYKFAVAEV